MPHRFRVALLLGGDSPHAVEKKLFAASNYCKEFAPYGRPLNEISSTSALSGQRVSINAIYTRIVPDKKSGGGL